MCSSSSAALLASPFTHFISVIRWISMASGCCRAFIASGGVSAVNGALIKTLKSKISWPMSKAFRFGFLRRRLQTLLIAVRPNFSFLRKD